MSSLSPDKYFVSGFQLSYPTPERRYLPCGAPTVARPGLLSPTLPRGLLSGRLPQRAHSHPHRRPGNARDLRACASTAPATESHPAAVDQSA